MMHILRGQYKMIRNIFYIYLKNDESWKSTKWSGKRILALKGKEFLKSKNSPPPPSKNKNKSKDR